MTFKDIPTAISYKSVGEKSFSKDLNPMPKCSKNIKEGIAIAGEI